MGGVGHTPFAQRLPPAGGGGGGNGGCRVVRTSSSSARAGGRRAAARAWGSACSSSRSNVWWDTWTGVLQARHGSRQRVGVARLSESDSTHTHTVNTVGTWPPSAIRAATQTLNTKLGLPCKPIGRVGRLAAAPLPLTRALNPRDSQTRVGATLQICTHSKRGGSRVTRIKSASSRGALTISPMTTANLGVCVCISLGR